LSIDAHANVQSEYITYVHFWDRKCVSLYGNDECNEECNTAACVYDGGDCAAREELPDILFIVLATNLDDFDARENSFLLSIGEILNCIPVLLGRTQSGGSPRAKRDETNSTSVSVDLKLDVSQCNSSVEGCVGSVEEASEILDRVSERGYRPAGFTIEETGTKNDPTDTTTPDSPFPLGAIGGIVVAILLFSVGFVVLGILLKRKRTMKAAIWRPEGPNTTPRSDSFDEDSPTAKRIVPGKERSSKDLHSESDGYPMKPVCEKGEWVDVPGEMETTVNGLPSAQFVVGQLQRDPPSWSALHYRALRQPSLVQEFVTRFNEETDNSTDVNIRGPGGYTTLMVAVMLGNVQREGEEESECDLTRPSLFNGSEAASPPRSLTVKDLLKMGADPNLKNELGQTALHIAASCSRADVTRLLLSYRADPNAQDCNGRSPLHVAIVSEADGVFQILLRNKNTNPDLDAEDGTTPLILATQHHAVSMVEQLLKEAHVDANTQDKSGKTALHWAASMNMMEIMKILLKQGANKDSQDNNGQTPLFLAAKEGSSDAVRLLMESLANRNIQDNMERTPLRIAESRFHKDIVHLLTDSYFSHIGETASQQPEVRIHGPVCHGLSRPDTYDYLPEATSVPPPPYQTQNYRTPYSSAAVYDSHLTTTTTHCSYRPCEPDGAEDILPSINGSPHSVGSGGVCTSNGMPTACSLEPCVPASIYDSTNTTTASQYPVDTRQPTELHDTLLQPMVSPMSGYSPPYTGDLIPQDLQHGSSLGVGTTSPEVFSNPNIDLNVHFYPSPPESNKSPCSYDNGMQIPTPPESDGQIESPPMASCVRLGPTIGFPANQGVYHGQQHPPLQQY
jgi:Notch-like protein